MMHGGEDLGPTEVRDESGPGNKLGLAIGLIIPKIELVLGLGLDLQSNIYSAPLSSTSSDTQYLLKTQKTHGNSEPDILQSLQNPQHAQTQ